MEQFKINILKMDTMTVIEVDELLNMCRDCLDHYPEDKKKLFNDIDELLDIRLAIMKNPPPIKPVKSKKKSKSIK